MANEKAFNDVLNFVAKSGLNFSIWQTPFSAQLSLKKSFVRKMNVYNEPEEPEEIETLLEKIKELENELSETTLEHQKLKKAIKENHNCESLKEDLKVKKKRVKKDVKKERQKVEKEISDDLEFRVDIEDDDDTERLSYIDIPIANKFSGLENIKEEIVDSHERSKKQDSSSQTDPLKCEVCDKNFLSESNLNEHTQLIHKVTSESSTQSDELKKCFDPYNCFYCESHILSESSLNDHVKQCHGHSSILKQQQLQSKSYQDQLSALQTMFTQMQTPKVKCEICNEEFLSDGMVQLHTRSEHDPTFSFLRKNKN